MLPRDEFLVIRLTQPHVSLKALNIFSTFSNSDLGLTSYTYYWFSSFPESWFFRLFPVLTYYDSNGRAPESGG